MVRAAEHIIIEECGIYIHQEDSNRTEQALESQPQPVKCRKNYIPGIDPHSCHHRTGGEGAAVGASAAGGVEADVAREVGPEKHRPTRPGRQAGWCPVAASRRALCQWGGASGLNPPARHWPGGRWVRLQGPGSHQRRSSDPNLPCCQTSDCEQAVDNNTQFCCHNDSINSYS